MWRPAALRLGYVGRPALRGPHLGQSNSVISEAAQAVVAQAEPRVRAIVAEERSRLANAAIQGLPFMGGALTAFLATQYLLPQKNRFVKGLGYVASAGLFTVGAWNIFRTVSGPESAPATSPSGSSSGGFITNLFGETAKEMAQEIVVEAEPKVRSIIDDEKAKLAEAGLSMLPLLGVSAAGFLATAFLIPDERKSWKFGGYMGSTAALLASFWQGLTVAS